ncbi:hypothetical protein CYY_005128 [Polysphondylium violaceum]|uniref:Probable UDP-N-acetylglucosamine--peptide N-acetylglucosaminyltransferase SPINDLY n=1 Tax=Polysphondylium violaceum TaxID=133409 RepID=A0A8J4PVM8_9MYCE|nr:hypothetical protein CYY_005128 [Polysphondylium violaceum]
MECSYQIIRDKNTIKIVPISNSNSKQNGESSSSPSPSLSNSNSNNNNNTSTPTSPIHVVHSPKRFNLININKQLDNSPPIINNNNNNSILSPTHDQNSNNGSIILSYNKINNQYKDRENFIVEIPNNISVSLDSFLIEVGTEFRLSGQLDEALHLYNYSRIYNPQYSPAYFYMGVVFYEKGDPRSALECYVKAIEINPFYPEALCNVGVIHKLLGDVEIAIDYYTRALTSSPNYHLVKNNLAIAFNDLGTQVKIKGDKERSLGLYKKSLFYNSKHSETYYNLGVLYSEARSIEKAIVCYELAINFNANYTEALNNLGVIYKDLDNIEQSLSYYRLALQSNPKFPQSLNNLGVIYTMQGKMQESKQFIKQAIRESPDYAEAYNNLGVIYRDIGKIDKSLEAYEMCIKHSPHSLNAPHNKLLASNYSNKPINEISKLHTLWGLSYMNQVQLENFEFINQLALKQQQNQLLKLATRASSPPSPLQQPIIATSPTTGETIVTTMPNIGYISADFFIHSVSYFIEGILKHHNAYQFRVYCYSNVAKEDSTTERLQSYQVIWRKITGLDAKAVCNLIVADQIDILVDLSGHTCGNRMDVMALKPAPIQISYIGYPNTTGLPSVQYRFTDETVDPLDTKQYFTEHLYRLPKCFLTYHPPICNTQFIDPLTNHLTDITPLPCQKNNFITFGSFNILSKYSDNCLKTWSKILLLIPNSRLLLKSKPFVCEKTKLKFKEKLVLFGFDPNRVDLIGLFPSQKDHLQYYKMMDISLDTYPYAGTTTTCEALWMGVPVITMSQPDIHSHNVGKTILNTLGLNELITFSESQYIETAIHLASHIEKLIYYRNSLRTTMKHSYFCDNVSFTKNLEIQYLNIWNQYILSLNNTSNINLLFSTNNNK